jgi:hypothetical protein
LIKKDIIPPKINNTLLTEEKKWNKEHFLREDDKLNKLSKIGDPLEKINKRIDSGSI